MSLAEERYYQTELDSHQVKDVGTSDVPSEAPSTQSQWRALGLDDSPFAARHRCDHFCPLPPLMLGVNRLLAALENQGIAMVTGQEGIGKTCVLHQVKALCHFQGVYIQGSSGLSVANLMKCLAIHAKIPLPPMILSLEQQIQYVLHGLAEAHPPMVMLIDDAHQLPLPTLAALMHFMAHQPQQRRPIRVLLAGDQALSERCQTMLSEAHQRLKVYHWHLLPWQASDIQHYVIWRLKQAGWAVDEGVIAQEWCETIASACQGMPAWVDQAAEQELLIQLQQRTYGLEVMDTKPWWQRLYEAVCQVVQAWPASTRIASTVAATSLVALVTLAGVVWWPVLGPVVHQAKHEIAQQLTVSYHRAATLSQHALRIQPGPVTEPLPPALASLGASEATTIMPLWQKGYALQFAGSFDAAAVERMRAQWPQWPLQVRQTIHQGKPWYVLVQGPYADAQEARGHAPQHISTWVRRLVPMDPKK